MTGDNLIPVRLTELKFFGVWVELNESEWERQTGWPHTVDHYLNNNKFHIIFDIFGKHQQLNILVYDIYFSAFAQQRFKTINRR